MALIGNYSVLNKTNTRYSNGTSTAGAYAGNTRANWCKPTIQYAKVKNSFPATTSIPEGYNVGEAYTRAPKSGGLSAVNQISGTGSLTATAILARLSEATLSGSGQIDSAALGAIVQAATELAGSGSLSAALGILTNMTSTLAGIGAVTADASAIVSLAANLSGSGAITANLKGVGSLAAEINIGASDPLSPEALAAAVWNAVLAEYNTAGSTGAALGDASAAGNPWSALLADNMDADTFGAFVQKLLTQAKFLGLK